MWLPTLRAAVAGAALLRHLSAPPDPVARSQWGLIGALGLANATLGWDDNRSWRALEARDVVHVSHDLTARMQRLLDDHRRGQSRMPT